jgi:hypothetical protein
MGSFPTKNIPILDKNLHAAYFVQRSEDVINNNYVCFQFVGSIVIYLIILIQTDPLASKIILTTLNGI